MTNQDTSWPTLDDFLAMVGLAEDNDTDLVKLEAFENALGDRLTADDGAALLVQAVQTLWLNPESNLEERTCHKVFLAEARTHRKTGLGGSEGLFRIQAILAHLWPPGTSQTQAIVLWNCCEVSRIFPNSLIEWRN